MDTTETKLNALKYKDYALLPGAEQVLGGVPEDDPLLARCVRRTVDDKILAAMIFDRGTQPGEAVLLYFFEEKGPDVPAGIFKILFLAAKNELRRSGYRSIFARCIGTAGECREAYQILTEVRFLPVHLMGRILSYTIADFFDSPFFSRTAVACAANDDMQLDWNIKIIQTADDAVILRIPPEEEKLAGSAFREYLAEVLSYATAGRAMDTVIYFELHLQDTLDRITSLLGKGEERFIQEYLYYIKG